MPLKFHHAENLKYDWFDCTTSIFCECGVCWIALDSSAEPKKCDYCGRTYRLTAFVEVTDPEVHAPSPFGAPEEGSGTRSGKKGESPSER